MLSNVYLHNVLDLWFEQEEDAMRVLAVLATRFARYGLRLHLEKTRLVDFRRPFQSARGGSQRERSFTLLGFTHYWGRSRKGRWVVQRKTDRNRFTGAVRAIGQWCQTHRHWSLADQQAALSRKLQGHYAYYGITGSARALGRFHYETRRAWRKWLNRRSWHGRMTWNRFARLAEHCRLPPPRVVHSIYGRAAKP